MKKRVISVVLIVCMLLTCAVSADYTAFAVTTDKEESAAPTAVNTTSANPYGLADSVDDGMILQAWNWSYKNAIDMLDKVGEAGFTTIQISPPNEIKKGTKGVKVVEPGSNPQNGWWMFYQPAGFQINESTDNALGTKAELIELVQKAHEKGIKVIADAVINHMGTCDNEITVTSTNPMDHVTPLAQKFEPEIYNNKLFHNPWVEMKYIERYDQGNDRDIEESLTQHCTSRLPDLNTADQRVQNAIYDYLKELADVGIDGFRFDAAKHIETPADTYFGSDFWDDTLVKVQNYAKDTYGKDLFAYGEILNTCGDGRPYSEYFKYMEITDTSIFWDIANNVHGGTASSAIRPNMVNGSKEQTILWAESHDSYIDGGTTNFPEVKRNKMWAVEAARDGITSLYLARPATNSQLLGVASATSWTSKAVAEVNKFSNNYIGQGEYLSSNSNVAIIGRGSKTSDGGAVLVNCSTTSTKAISNMPVNTLADGQYQDRISGSTFTVTGGKVSGTIGSTGIAVLYEDDKPSVSAGTQSGKYYTSTLSLKLNSKNVDSATYSYNGSAEIPFTSGQTVTIGSAADTKGATYKVTVKGYTGGQVVCSNTYTYTKSEQQSSYEVTFKPNGVWSGSTFYCHHWNQSTQAGSTWPGDPMTPNGDGSYSITIPATDDMILFDTGLNGKQTVDIPINDSTIYTLSSQTTSNGGGTTCNTVTETPGGNTDPTYYPGVDNPTTAPSTSTAPVSQYSLGDVNRDKSVDISDVTFIQKSLVLLVTLDSEQMVLADYNKSGTVNIKDATAIQYAILK